MNEQKLLFQEQDVWIERLWLAVPAAKRRQILGILAEMARAALSDQRSSAPEEAHDER